MQYRSLWVLGLLGCIAVILAGCTGIPGSSGTTGPGSSSPSDSTGASTQVQNNLVPSPTDVLPSQNQVTITVKEKDNYTAKIPVFFDGGKGQIHVTKIEATVYTSDGKVQTVTIGTNKGDFVELDGTKQTDRVVVYVSFDNGDRIKTIDELAQYRTRNPK